MRLVGSKGGADHVTDAVVVVTEVTCTDSGGSGTGRAASECVCLSVWECELIFTELQVNNVRPIFTAAAEI